MARQQAGVGRRLYGRRHIPGRHQGRTEKQLSLYGCCHQDGNQAGCIAKVRPLFADGPAPGIIVNSDRKEFVRLAGLPEEDPEDLGWHIHPLPLLTCSGNGRGGGDFRGNNLHVGIWAGHHISSAFFEPEGYRELKPGFTEL